MRSGGSAASGCGRRLASRPENRYDFRLYHYLYERIRSEAVVKQDSVRFRATPRIVVGAVPVRESADRRCSRGFKEVVWVGTLPG